MVSDIQKRINKLCHHHDQTRQFGNFPPPLSPRTPDIPSHCYLNIVKSPSVLLFPFTAQSYQSVDLPYLALWLLGLRLSRFPSASGLILSPVDHHLLAPLYRLCIPEFHLRSVSLPVYTSSLIISSRRLHSVTI